MSLTDVNNVIEETIGWRLVRHRPREFFQDMIKLFKGRLVTGCEIGVWKGETSRDFFKYLNVEKLYLIDPYDIKVMEDYKKKPVYKKRLLNAEKYAHKILGKYKDKCVWIKKESEKCSEEVPELDFIYVDGINKNIKENLRLYYPKIKQGGMFMGDDFEMKSQGVVNAILEFVHKEGLELFQRNGRYWFYKTRSKTC